MPGLRRILALMLLASAALGARVAAVELLSARHAAPVSYEHGKIARNLLAGRGFSVMFLGVDGPTSQQAPFYPALLAGAYRVYGIDAPEAHRAVQRLQCLIGLAEILAVFWLSRSLAPRRPAVAWAAAWFAALYPPHIYMATHLQVAIWATAGLTLTVAAAADPRWQRSRGGRLAIGALSGGLLLIEPILAVALPVVGWMVWRGNRNVQADVVQAGPRAWRRALVVSVAATLIVTPWLVRNALVHGEFVFVKSTFGYAFWQGNNPHSWGTDKIPKSSAEILRQAHDGSLAERERALWEARHETLYIDDVLLKPAGFARFAGLTEPERSRQLGREAVAAIQADPRRYAELCLRRLRYFLLFDETNPKAADPIYRWSTATWLVLAVVGLLVARESWPRLAPTMLIFLAVLTFHALTITAPRFRMPVEALSFVWVGAAVAPLGDRWVRRTSRLSSSTASADQIAGRAVLAGPHRRLRKSTSAPRPGVRSDLDHRA